MGVSFLKEILFSALLVLKERIQKNQNVTLRLAKGGIGFYCYTESA